MYLGRISSSVVLLLVIAAASRGELLGHHCPSCGCQNLAKRCKLVCETKTETKTEYCCECEDICIPGRSKRCASSDCCSSHCGVTLLPTCGNIRTVRKLVKKEISKEVPTYKCVVEYVCPQCGACR